MLQRERGQMRIGHEIGVHTGQCEEYIQKIDMAIRRLRYPCRFASKPGAHLAPCICHWLGSLEHAGISDQAQESHQADPGQANACRTIKLLVEPVTRRFTLRE